VVEQNVSHGGVAGYNNFRTPDLHNMTRKFRAVRCFRGSGKAAGAEAYSQYLVQVHFRTVFWHPWQCQRQKSGGGLPHAILEACFNFPPFDIERSEASHFLQAREELRLGRVNEIEQVSAERAAEVSLSFNLGVG
jgi:hypothetical protein